MTKPKKEGVVSRHRGAVVALVFSIIAGIIGFGTDEICEAVDSIEEVGQ